MAKEKNTRLNLAIPESVRQRIEALQEATEAQSLTEVIRRALAVYEFLVKEKADGARVVSVKKGQTVEIALL